MKLICASLLAVAMSGAAFADDQSQGQGYGLIGQGQQALLSLSDLKAKCVELQANQQIKPFKIQVTCSDVSYVWREAPPAHIALSNLREVGASLRMKSFEVPYSGENVPIDQTPAACTVLERIKLTVPAVDVEVSCDELNMIDSLAQFCLPHIDNRAKEDPGLVLSEQTGETFNTCGSMQAQQGLK